MSSEINLHNPHLMCSYTQMDQSFKLFKRKMQFHPLVLLSIPAVSGLQAECGCLNIQQKSIVNNKQHITMAICLPTIWLDTVAPQQCNYLLCPQRAEELWLFCSLLLHLIILFHLLVLVDQSIDETSLQILIFHDSLSNCKLAKKVPQITLLRQGDDSNIINTAVGASVHMVKATEGVQL